MGTVRSPAVAGSFYPRSADVLRQTIADLLAAADPAGIDVTPAMLIVPHAGYVYSGPVAATAYRCLTLLPSPPRRLVLFGPSHYVGFAGVATSGASAFQTPLGLVATDPGPAAGLIDNPTAHAREHSLEVQLPFLQVVLGSFTVQPMLTGDIAPEDAAEVLDEALAERHLAVISSDLSHYLAYDEARRRDEATASAIVELRAGDLRPGDACGVTAIQAGLLVARRRDWQCRQVDLRNSGDTAGDRSRVVGYGAFVIGPA
jgi:AmmeMemoRadiSam system protein B